MPITRFNTLAIRPVARISRRATAFIFTRSRHLAFSNCTAKVFGGKAVAVVLITIVDGLTVRHCTCALETSIALALMLTWVRVRAHSVDVAAVGNELARINGDACPAITTVTSIALARIVLRAKE